MKKYTCTGCKSVFYEGNVPAKCPICGCEAGFFKVTTASDDEVKANSAEEAKPTQPEPQNNVYSTNASSTMPRQDVVTVWGYHEYFAIETAVEVYKNGLLIGSVSPKKKIEVPVEGECELKFKCGMSSTTCRVKGGDWVVLSMKSQLKAILANPSNYDEIVAGLQEEAASSKSRKFTLLWIGVAFFVALFAFPLVFNNNKDDGTTETVYTTPDGLEIVLCDNGFARVGNYEGKWDNSGYFTMGNNGISFTYITSSNGQGVYCSICRDALYWGGRSTVVSEYPNGIPLKSKRR